MRVDARNVALGMILVLLLLTFYPAIMLNRRLAPEASLRSTSPWRQEWGPNPEPPARVLAAATQLGPRLAVISRDGFAAALWDPWVGGGRAGWLSSPREGGAPLPVVAALLARPEWVWSALVALTVAASFAGVWLASRWSGAGAWAAAAAATAYALAGPVASHWLDWRGSAVALGPLALLPALAGPARWGRKVAAWSLAIGVTVLAGPPAIPFVALALARELIGKERRSVPWRLAVVGAAMLLVVLARSPIAWLEAAGCEPGARPAPIQPSPPLAGLRAIVSASDERERSAKRPSGSMAPEASAESGLIGAAPLALALLGMFAARRGDREFWGVAVAASMALAFVPSSWLVAARLTQRPNAVLALGVALLAGAGVDDLLRRMRPGWGPATGAAICAVLILELAPFALHEMPFVTAHEANLAPPLPLLPPTDGSRVVTMMEAVPPDSAAYFALSDVRASSFTREPVYQELVRGRRDGAGQVLDPVFAKLGARWVIEPASVRVVSGAVFGAIDVIEAPRSSGPDTTSARYQITIPRYACRLGLPWELIPNAAVFVQDGSRTTALANDRALAEESADWRWVGLTDATPRGDVSLGLIGPAVAPASLSIAIDSSGLRLAAEDQSVRLWEWERAEAFARIEPAQQRASARIATLRPGRVEIDAACERPSALIVQVKRRPALWRVRVDGRPAAVTTADDLWTAISVPAGASRVVLAATIPVSAWLLMAAAAIIVALLGLLRRFA